jgi:hypothetical protein
MATADARVAALLRSLAGRPRFAAIVDAYVTAQARGTRRGFGSNALKVDGKLFALFTRGTLVVKLPRARVDELVEAGVGKRFDPGHGRPTREWLELTRKAQPWLQLVEEAHGFAVDRVPAGRGPTPPKRTRK